jgi:hypothetical protein
MKVLRLAQNINCNIRVNKMAKSATLRKVVSPKGEFRWVCITGEGEENMSGKMQYKVDLVLAEGAKHPFIAEINKFWEDNKPAGYKKKAKSLGYYFCDKVLDDDGEPVKDEEDKFVYDKDGAISVSFKTSVSFPDGKTKKVKTRTAKGALIELGDILIGNGSEGYVAGAMDIYKNVVKGKIMDAGVALYLDELKITKLVEFGGADPFGDEGSEDEDGWDGSDVDAFVGTEEEEKVRL